MRLFILGLSLSFSITAFAVDTTVDLKPIIPYKVNGSVSIDPNPIMIEYGLNDVTPNQRYGVYLYAKGDCSSYSELIQPKRIGASGKIEKFYWDADYLINTKKGPDDALFGSEAQKPEYKFHQTKFKKTVFVIKEINGTNPGAAVACGIHP